MESLLSWRRLVRSGILSECSSNVIASHVAHNVRFAITMIALDRMNDAYHLAVVPPANYEVNV